MTLRRSVCLCLAVLTSFFLPQGIRAEKPLVSHVPAGTQPGDELLPEPVRKEQPLGIPLAEVLVLDDATKVRGQSATGQMPDALIFWQPHDSGFGWYMKSDDVFGYGTWANQMIFGNGVAPGDEITAYDLLIHNGSTAESGDDASFMTELWTGDPSSIMDTICTIGGISAPIPGTQALFTDVPPDSLVRLRAELSKKVTFDCDRVWMVTTMLEGCSAGWRIAGSDGEVWNNRATEGYSDGVWLQYACEQFGVCETPNGYNAGTCCGTNATCDHTNDEFDCGPGDPTFCGDGDSDYFVAAIDETEFHRSLVGTVWGPSRVIVSLMPVGTGPNGEISENAVIEGNEITLAMDGKKSIPVFFEFRIGDWDPDDTGIKLNAWQMSFDSGSYTTGLQGTLTPYLGPGGAGGGCSGPGDDGPCVTALGKGAVCDPAGAYFQQPPGTCTFAFINESRPDFVYATVSVPIIVLDLSTANIRTAGAVLLNNPPDDPVPFPKEGLYAGTIAIQVPPDARGTFTITAKQPNTQLIDQESEIIPRLAIAPAKIIIDIGRCCFNLQDVPIGGGECTTDLSADECALMSGTTWHDPDKTCDDPCPEVCGDNLLNRPAEECDGTDDDACPGSCLDDCRCAFCGDQSTNQESEECDGFDDEACPGICRFDCTCTRECGDNIQVGDEECDGKDDSACLGECLANCLCPGCGDDSVNQVWEECDGSDDTACPTFCLEDCSCDTFCGDNEINQPGEECDGTDDDTCPGVCLSDCTCAVCGDNEVNQPGEECDGLSDSFCPGHCREDCTCDPCSTAPRLADLIDVSFGCDDSLPRVGRAVLRFEFDDAIAVPPFPGLFEIRRLLPGGAFDETDLSDLFEFTVENDVFLRVQEDGCVDGICDFSQTEPRCVDGPDKGLPCGRVLENETWYAFMNTGNWCTTTDFQLHYAVVYGDANNDHVTSFGDLSAINSMLSVPGVTPDDSRFDINTIGGVSFADLSAAIAFINSSTLNAKPSGHVCTPIP